MTISILFVLNIFIKNLLITKSIEDIDSKQKCLQCSLETVHGQRVMLLLANCDAATMTGQLTNATTAVVVK